MAPGLFRQFREGLVGLLDEVLPVGAEFREERPDDLRDAYEIALGNGKSWRTRLQASLDRMPDTARILARFP